MRIAIAQLDPTIGDFDGNRRKLVDAAGAARSAGADLLVASELLVTGYMPQDLLEHPAFLAAAEATVLAIAAEVPDLALLFGTVTAGSSLQNSAVLTVGGQVRQRFHKTLLPTYDVFDESRYFEAADGPGSFEWMGQRIGVTICEDLWTIPGPIQPRAYRRDPLAELIEGGIDLVVNLSASPWQRGKAAARSRMFRDQAARAGVPIAFANQIGGNDHLVFDGHSALFAPDGRVVARASGFAEDLLVVETDQATDAGLPDDEGPDALRRALVLGIRDYVAKTGFERAVIGLSGGIDSAVTAALTAEALGPEQVTGVAMPSRYSADASLDDARALAAGLGIAFKVLPIEGPFEAFLELLSGELAGREPDVTEENLQARTRGVILMALSNKDGSIVITTGNKSELAVGYCTLYGDMAGGLAAISDVPKTQVYELARHLNEQGEIIPTRTIDRPPSAELRPDQTDQDSLPPYDVLDAILSLAIEQRLDEAAIVEAGFEPAVVADVLGRVRRNEYKRRQAAPGLKVTSKAFGFGRRYPIARR